MSSSLPELDPRAKQVFVGDDELTVHLAYGRRISVPLTWFPRLLHASPAERRHFELLGDGQGIHWPELDEDVSVAGLLRGERARVDRGEDAAPDDPGRREEALDGQLVVAAAAQVGQLQRALAGHRRLVRREERHGDVVVPGLPARAGHGEHGAEAVAGDVEPAAVDAQRVVDADAGRPLVLARRAVADVGGERRGGQVLGVLGPELLEVDVDQDAGIARHAEKHRQSETQHDRASATHGGRRIMVRGARAVQPETASWPACRPATGNRSCA